MPVLSILIFLPAAGALLILAAQRRSAALARGLAVGVVWVVLAIAVVLHVAYPIRDGGIVWREYHWWLPYWGTAYDVSADGLSLTFALLTCLVCMIGVSGLRGSMGAGELASVLLLESALLGTFLARDAILFYVFWQLTLVPLAYLGARGRGEGRAVAASVLGYGGAGGLALLICEVWLALHRAGIAGRLSFDISWLTGALLPWPAQGWVFAGLAFAFLSRAGLWPFHRWMVAAHLHLPPPAVLLLNAVALKAGAYGLLRFCVPMVPDAIAVFFPLLMALAYFGLFYGAVAGLMQQDLRAKLALFSSAQLNVIVIAILSVQLYALEGSAAQIINHTLVVSAWLLIAFAVCEGRADLRFEGLRGALGPSGTAGALFVFTLAWLGLPGTGGFIGLALLLPGLVIVHWWLAPLLLLGVLVLGVGLFLTLGHLSLPTPEQKGLRLQPRELGILLALAALTIWLGLVSQIFMARTHPSMARLAAQSMLRRTERLGGEPLTPESRFPRKSPTLGGPR